MLPFEDRARRVVAGIRLYVIAQRVAERSNLSGQQAEELAASERAAARKAR